MQLAHAGRKGSMHLPWEQLDTPLRPEEGGWQTVAPSPIAFQPNWPAPKKMEREDMDRVISGFVHSAHLAEQAGFDMIELHMAHGYLLSSFISPLSNRRRDDYGGSLENRMRFPLEVFRAVRESWPEDKPISVRISASDWMADDSGIGPEDSVVMALYLKEAGCDLVDVSSGGNSQLSEPEYGRMYQVPFAEQIRFEAGIPVAAVGGLLGADHANTVLAAGRADLAVMARAHLRDAYLTLHAAEKYEFWDQPWPNQYLAAKPRPGRPSNRRR
jgi:anthraniloyl-CoA monooxygenase